MYPERSELRDAIKAVGSLDDAVRRMPLDDRVAAARALVATTVARGGCAHCAESAARRAYGIPVDVAVGTA